MAVRSGLKSLAQSDPEFSNNSVVELIDACNIGFVNNARQLIQTARSSEILTNSQRADMQSTLENQAYLNIGTYLENLKSHTAKILTGELGEQDPNDDRPNTGTFLDHLQQVQGFESSYTTLYGETADSNNKGINSHFGSLFGSLDSTLTDLKNTLDQVSRASLSAETAYENSLNDLEGYIVTLDDSTEFVQSTFDGHLNSIDAAANSFNSALQSGYAELKTSLETVHSAIVDQISLETANLGSIRTTEESLLNHFRYLGFAGNKPYNQALVRISGNSEWKSYYENYDENLDADNPVFGIYQDDSSLDPTIDAVMRLRGLPDVTDYVNLPEVAKKTSRDSRLKDKINYNGTTHEQVISDACKILGLFEVLNQSSYEQSKLLLKNMNAHDRSLIEAEFGEYRTVNTLS